MSEDKGIVMNPIGVVRSSTEKPGDVPIPGQYAEIEIFSQYSQALLRIEANSNLWALLWFHQSDRNCLRTVPRRVNPNLPEYGVFGLRSPNRPNPIGLCLVKLDSVEGNILHVHNLDAINNTPVLDIKPYYEQDIIFSPTTPYIPALDIAMRRNIFLKEALAHHQESCPDLYLAVRMGLIADQIMGHLNSPLLKLWVNGSPCLADTLQGLSRARLANPPRFAFQDSTVQRSVWESPDRRLTLTARLELNENSFRELSDEEIFIMELKEL